MKIQVWFAGAHCDVGGGASPNGTRHMLSRIPLRWMMRQCFECNTGIIFNTASLAEVGLDVPTLWPVYKTPKKPFVGPSPALIERYRSNSNSLAPLRNGSTKSTTNGTIKSQEPVVTDIYSETNAQTLAPELIPEQAEDHFDALAPINDQLVLAKGWWVLEFWPIKVRVLKGKPQRWEKKVRCNMGRFRPIREREPKLHWTVQTRMEEQGYKIKNLMDDETTWQIAV